MWLYINKFLRTGIPAVDRALLALGRQIANAFVTAIDPVANIAALAAYATVVAGWPEGFKKYVDSVRDNFTLTRTSAPLVTDGITIVSAGPANTYWIRDLIPAARWQEQATWFVNPGAVGSDEASGVDSAHPLKTVAEWRRRVGVVKIDMVLTCMADIPDADEFPYLPVDDKGRLIVQGTLTEVETGVVDAVTAENPAAPGGGTPLQFSKAAGDFSAHVGRLVYFTERNSYGFIAKDMPGGTHFAAILPPRAYASDWDTSGTATPPQAGDHYHIYTASRLPARPYPTQVELDGNARLMYDKCEMPAAVAAGNGIQISAASLTYLRRTRLSPEGGFVVLNGYINQSIVCLGSPLTTFDHAVYFRSNSNTRGILALGNPAGGVRLNVQQTAQWNCIGPVMCVGISFSVYVDSGVLLNGGNLSVFDAFAGGLILREGATLDIHVASAKVYGNGNTGKGCTLYPSARIWPSSATQLYITGSTGDLDMGAANLMPALEASAGGNLPAAAPCGTWAQLFAAPFAGRAINYDTLASITPP